MRNEKISWLSTGALLCAAAIAAGCSGGGGGGASPVTKNQPPATTSSKTKYNVSIKFTTATSSKSKTTARAAMAAIGSKKPQYISPATLGAIVTATSTDGQSANNATSGYDLSTANPACEYVSSEETADALVCTIVIPLAADTYSIQLATYDQNEAGLSGAGNELSVDVESETVSAGASNSFTFNPHAFVVGWDIENQEEDSAVRSPGLDQRTRAFASAAAAHGRSAALASRRASTRSRFDAASATVAGRRQGTIGGDFNFFDIYAGALDLDLYFIDQYPGDTTFANGVFSPTDTEGGDGTGCDTADVCSEIFSSDGSTFPSYGPTPGPSSPPVTITNPETSQESLEVAYSGGGGVGSGIENWLVETYPTGTTPFYIDASIPNAPAGSFGTVASYVQPHYYVVPLYGYSTDGAGNPTNTTAAGGGKIYVWAAQAMLPTGANADGSSYTALFGTSSTCLDSNDNVVMTVNTNNAFAPTFGEVWEIDVSQTFTTVSCTLDLSDGTGDTTSLTLQTTPTIIGAQPRPVTDARSHTHLLGSR